MISRKDFYTGNFKKRFNILQEHPILAFLRRRKDKAWTAKEIAKHTKRVYWGVRGTLAKLKKKKLVDHEEPYYIFKVNNARRKKSK